MQRLVTGLFVLLVGGASWTPLGREFIKAFFWDRVMHYAIPILTPVGSWAADFAIPFAIVLLGLYLMVGHDRAKATWARARTKVNFYLLGLAISVSIGVVCLIGYFIDRARGPIVWTLDLDHPIATSMPKGGPPLMIFEFDMVGWNRWNEPFKVKSAFVKSDLTLREVPLAFTVNGTRVLPARVVIPGDTKFRLGARIQSPDPNEVNGLTAAQFKAEFGRFSVILECETATFVKSFSDSDVANYIGLGEKRGLADLSVAQPARSVTVAPH